MKFKYKTYQILFALGALGIAAWFSFSYPLFSDIDLSVNRDEALKIAKNYISKNYTSDISQFKKSIIFSSLLWGFGHSGYLVFPMWFRGVEVTLIGLFIAFIYLKYGLVTVIVAHYLFDVFWCSIGYLFGKADPVYFYSSVAILALPLFFALYAFYRNDTPTERALQWKLNKHQKYNLEVLKTYLASCELSGRSKESIKKDIISYGWDIAVAEIAVDQIIPEETQ